MKEIVLRLENVYKTYHLGEIETRALRDINLKIYKGSFLSIVGPSGSGKSTLLNIMGLLDFPEKGKVFVEDKDITTLSLNELAKIRGEKIGFVFQQFNLIQHLTALENVILPMLFQNVSEVEAKKRAKELLKMVGLEEKALRRPYQLSGGEQQRIAIARALVNNPSIILADEPTGNLDSKTGKMVMEIFKHLHQDKQRTIIVVTHDSYIASYGDQKILIQDGQIISNHQTRKNYIL
ncbi:ABC transporter ATP-binding protein [bacterium]|nr:ABC transporter ATP-binding protein [bacterium]